MIFNFFDLKSIIKQISLFIYISTQRRLSAEGRWGSHKNPTFEEMYHSFNGPTINQLYDTTKYYSPYIHTFLIVHPTLLHVSKADVGSGYMVYIGPSEMWNGATSPYPVDQVDWNLYQPSNVIDDINIVKQYPQQYMYAQRALTIEDANNHLRYGYNDPVYTDSQLDPRLGMGEFVIMIIFEHGKTAQQIRIHSPAYAWRSSIRDDNPNLPNQFYHLTTDTLAFRDKDGLYDTRGNSTNNYQKRFWEKYPIINHDYDQIVDHIDGGNPLISVVSINKKQDMKTLIKDRDMRIKIVWTSLLLAIPIHSQKLVATYYDYYYDSRDELIEWIRDLSKIDDYEDLLRPNGNNFERIIGEATKSSTKIVSASKPSDNNPTPNVQELIGSSIENLIKKERGGSLYQMVKTMNDITKDDEEQKYSEISK